MPSAPEEVLSSGESAEAAAVPRTVPISAPTPGRTVSPIAPPTVGKVEIARSEIPEVIDSRKFGATINLVFKEGLV
jgi:hypothetical protein